MYAKEWFAGSGKQLERQMLRYLRCMRESGSGCRLIVVCTSMAAGTRTAAQTLLAQSSRPHPAPHPDKPLTKPQRKMHARRNRQVSSSHGLTLWYYTRHLRHERFSVQTLHDSILAFSLVGSLISRTLTPRFASIWRALGGA